MLKSFLTAMALALGLILPGIASAEGEPLADSVITGFAPFQPPDGEILFADGTRKTLRDFPGELVLATVWFTTCPGCQIEMPRLKSLAEQLEAEGETRIRVLPISIDNVVFREDTGAALARVGKYYDRRKLGSLPVALDVDGANAGLLFNPDPVATPTTFFISPDGMIVAVVQGSLADWNAPESKAYLKSLAGS